MKLPIIINQTNLQIMNKEQRNQSIRVLLFFLMLLTTMALTQTVQAQSHVDGSAAQPTAVSSSSDAIADPASTFGQESASDPVYRYYQSNPDNRELYDALKSMVILKDPAKRALYPASEIEAMKKRVETLNQQLNQVQPLLDKGLTFEQALERIRLREAATQK